MAVPTWRWQAVMFASVFLSCVSFAIVMPSLWPYLESLGATKQFLAWVVALYSVGEALGAVALGALSARYETRTVSVLSVAVGLAGSVLYVAAPAGGACAPAAVLAGRFLQGVWTGGAQATQQAHLAKVLPPSALTRTTVTLNAYACLGFVFGPAFGLLASAVPPFGVGGGLRFDELTAAGYFVLVSAVLIIVAYCALFGGDEEHAERDAEGERLLDGGAFEERVAGYATDSAAHERLLGALVVCNIAFFIHFYGFALQETITTPLVQAYYSWDVFAANLLFTCGALTSLIVFVLLIHASRYATDYALTAASLALGACGFALLLSTPAHPLSVARFIAGFMAISAAFPIGRAAVIALYTKLLPRAWQGAGQGVILAVGAAARVVGPFWAVRAFSFRLGGLVVFGVTVVLFCVTLGLFVACRDVLRGAADDAAPKRHTSNLFV